MWVRFVVPVQSDSDGTVVPYETVIVTRVQSIAGRGAVVEGGQTLDAETSISLERFFPPAEDESEFVDAYLCPSAGTTHLVLTCGDAGNSARQNCYQLKVCSVLFFESLDSERFAKLLE